MPKKRVFVSVSSENALDDRRRSIKSVILEKLVGEGFDPAAGLGARSHETLHIGPATGRDREERAVAGEWRQEHAVFGLPRAGGCTLAFQQRLPLRMAGCFEPAPQ